MLSILFLISIVLFKEEISTRSKSMKKLISPLVLVIFLATACAAPPAENAPAVSPPEPTAPPPTEPPSPTTPPTEETASPETALVELTSPEFNEGGMIPDKFGCKGAEVSPTLNWTEPPAGTQSFAFIMDDPNAPMGTWVHWVLYNIPADTRSLPENVPGDPTLADGSMHGENSWPRTEYGGPCPPVRTHSYFFKLYALDIMLTADPGLTKEELLSLMEGHILQEVHLTGRYGP
jgi:Raf kinase inhibitor-like YbhB/YbcL family protein